MSINASTHVYSENAVEEATETTPLLGNVSIYKLFHSLINNTNLHYPIK